jgi:hypothetical protein
MSAFISHSQQDRGIFSALRAGLTAQGVTTWDPESMGAGGSLRDQLREAINNCDVCVFLATRNSVESRWCMAELGAFWGAGKRVLVFMADPSVTEEQFPPQLRGDLWTNDFERVVRDVGKIVSDAGKGRE